MPPKRLRRNSPAASGPAAGERLKRAKLAGSDYSAWGWVGSEVTDASEISQSHRLASCGFSTNITFPLCLNEYSSSSGKSMPAQSALQKSQGKVANGELEDDIIVISDDEGPSCSSKDCKSNPYCLNYLGQEKWEDEDKAREAFLKHTNTGENPIYLARDPGSPIGLRNLGATCYANAFLQVWFQDLAFRRGVYQCLPPQDSTQKFEESPIFQLQVTFAAMQESTQNVFNPVKLVESLRLRTTEQQDAQEFSKLFMAHLDSEFQKQSVPGLKSSLADQFQGKQVYGTLCSGCQQRSERESEFLEVEVNLPKNNCKLEDRISALLQSEELSGDNRYFCSRCDALKDAKRYTEFRQLPPVLHVSLLRFVFDLQSMERKKSKNAISFPLTLDMGPFLGSTGSRTTKQEDVSRPNNIYHLRGILLHKGSSAYHGHYEAQVYDVQNKSWYQFNDEIVTKIPLLVPQSKPLNLKDSSQSSQRGRPRKRPRIEDSDVEIIETPTPKSEAESLEKYVSSKDAYMLVYARAEPTPHASPGPESSTTAAKRLSPVADAQIPPRALEVVNSMNAEFDQACDEYTQREKDSKERFEEKRRLVMDIYQTWRLSSREEVSAVVSRQALDAWLSRYLVKPSKPSSDKDESRAPLVALSEDKTTCTISNRDITCEHGKLDPEKASNMKRISKTAARRIVQEDHCSFVPELESTDVCETCVKDIFSERLYQMEHPRIVSRFDEVSYVDEDEFGYWISKPWLKDWRLNKPKMHEAGVPDPPPDDPEFASHVRCEHDGLATNQTNRKHISSEGYDLLKEIFPQWSALSTDAEVCPVCEAQLHISREDKREIRRQAEDEKAKLKHMYEMAMSGSSAPIEDEPCAIIPSPFLRAWKQWLFRPSEVHRPEGIDNTQFLCCHGNLILDPNIATDLENDVAIIRQRDYDVLEELYPCGPLIHVESSGDAIEHTPPVCHECRTERRSTFETTVITVRILRPTDPVPTPGSYNQSFQTTQTAPEAGIPRPRQPGLITYGSRKVNGIRQSKRIRQVNGHDKKAKVTINREMTVKALKIELSEKLKIPTIYQRLFHRGREVEDNAVTLVSLGVVANDTLDLREEAEDVDLIASDDEDRRRKPNDEGPGFGGTLLGGGDHAQGSASSDKNDPPKPAERSCPACTFVNPPEVLACAICDTVLYTDS